jgi:hypothetical protein
MRIDRWVNMAEVGSQGVRLEPGKSAVKTAKKGSRRRHRNRNLETLEGTLRYLRYQRGQGAITPAQFSDLAAYSCAIFIQNEVENRLLSQLWKGIFR